MNDVNESVLKYLLKYGDYFGNVLIMGYDNLGLAYSKFDEELWDFNKKIEHASLEYYWRYNLTAKECLGMVKLEYSNENLMEMAKVIKKYFGEDCYHHFILKGKDRFYYCEQRQEKNNI